MKKIVLISLCLFVVLTGCEKIKTPPQDEPSMTDKFLTALAEAGLAVGGDNIVSIGGGMIGADTGWKLTIGGETVEVYEYASASPEDEKALQFLSEIRANGKVTLYGFAVDAMLNKTLVLINYGNHALKDKIIEAFTGVT